MNAQELRVGNIVQAPNQPEFIITEGRQIDEAGFYQPIPLTEEWLVKLGCGYTDVTNSFECPESEFGTLDVVKETETGKYLLIQDFNLTLARVEYVHQLQNLYFALTGKELEIKR